MKEDSTLYSVSPDAYAEYLEGLTDTEFWDHAYEKAYMPRSEHAAHALTTIATPSDDDTLTCITCNLREGHCLLPLSYIREILPLSQQVTRLPDVPFWMLGILSWRGETLAAIDLCAYLTRSKTPLPSRVFLITQHEHITLALCVLAIGSNLVSVNIDEFTPFTLPPAPEGIEGPVGPIGMWKRDNNEYGYLDIPALFADAVQHIERKLTHE